MIGDFYDTSTLICHGRNVRSSILCRKMVYFAHVTVRNYGNIKNIKMKIENIITIKSIE